MFLCLQITMFSCSYVFKKNMFLCSYVFKKPCSHVLMSLKKNMFLCCCFNIYD